MAQGEVDARRGDVAADRRAVLRAWGAISGLHIHPAGVMMMVVVAAMGIVVAVMMVPMAVAVAAAARFSRGSGKGEGGDDEGEQGDEFFHGGEQVGFLRCCVGGRCGSSRALSV